MINSNPPQNNDTDSQIDKNQANIQGSVTIMTMTIDYEINYNFNVDEQTYYA